ncbi:helix-turn-helix domain-containing protein [Neobacillus niacini]|uniref:helix-turn-helix domain-containing protein n=1 Tax=Neobacillus niacini TaxID=86668 RepID=UPI00069478AE|nr:AraC family transcriptional regulator [Neobacillus niacini]
MEDIKISSAIVKHDAGWSIEHQHSSVEISTVLEGKGIFCTGNLSKEIQKGSVILIENNVDHCYKAATSIRFGVLMADGLPEETRKLFEQLITTNQSKIISLSSYELNWYMSLFKNWLSTISLPFLKEKNLLIKNWIEILLLSLLQHAHVGEKVISVTQAADVIRNHLDQEIIINHLAGQTGLSESTFRRYFKEEYGVSPKQFQQQYRMAEAKWLLRSSEKSIQEIGEHIGFSSVHPFSSWFKKCEGINPSEWRKLQQTGLLEST